MASLPSVDVGGILDSVFGALLNKPGSASFLLGIIVILGFLGIGALWVCVEHIRRQRTVYEEMQSHLAFHIEGYKEHDRKSQELLERYTLELREKDKFIKYLLDRLLPQEPHSEDTGQNEGGDEGKEEA